MDLTRAAIEKSRVTAILLLGLAIGGQSAYRGLSRADDPGFIVRHAQVVTGLPGASPDRIEHLITDVIEAAIQEIPEVEFIESTSKTGGSIVLVKARDEYDDMRSIWDNLRRKVGRVVPDLPDGIIGPSINDEFGDVFGIVVTLTGEGYSYAELKAVADQVRDELLRVEDVAKVEIYGAQSERIFVDYNNTRLAELGLAPLQLRSILENANIIIPGGDIRTGVERIALEPTGNFESLDELRRTVVTLPGNAEIVYLEDFVEISRGYADPPGELVYASGTPGLALALALREGGNMIALGERIDRELVRLRAAYPIGVEFDVAVFQPKIIDAKVQQFMASLQQSVLMVFGLVLVFLGLRTGLVVAMLVPMTISTSFLVMSVFGIGIDQISLASLIIALGMLVDNAIVMAESILVQMSQGRRPIDAAVDSARELRFPLLISSLTTSAAFLPIYLAKSVTGEYTAPLFKVVTIALVSSWVLALTMTPLLCVAFLTVKRISPSQRFDIRLYRSYRRVLLAGLRHRTASLLLVSGILILAYQGLRALPTIFFPPSDEAIFTAEYSLPNGTSIERTMEVVEEIDRFIARQLLADGGGGPTDPAASAASLSHQGITNWATFVGKSCPRFYLAFQPKPPKPNYAISILNATSRSAITEEIIPALDAFCVESFPDLDVKLNPLQIGPPIDAPVEVRLSGYDLDLLFDMVDKVKARMREIEGVRNVTDDWGVRSKKLVVDVDQPRARRAGITNQDVAISLQTAVSGIETTRYRERNESIPVTLRSMPQSRNDISRVESLNVYAQATGRAVPLRQVADAAVVWEPGAVHRRNRIRTVTVASDIAPGGTASEVVAQIRPWLEAEQEGWPVGFRFEFGGEEETSVQSNESIAEQMPIALMIIIGLLVFQFNSIRRATIVLLTIPFGLVGVVVGLLVAQSYFGFMTLLGVVALSGIIVNNAVVLLDRIRIEIENGVAPPRAIVEASQKRFRPIMLTTATTVSGLLPLWISGGSMWEPMVIAIVFGLVFATGVTLWVVPILYSILFRVRFQEVTMQQLEAILDVDLEIALLPNSVST